MIYQIWNFQTLTPTPFPNGWNPRYACDKNNDTWHVFWHVFICLHWGIDTCLSSFYREGKRIVNYHCICFNLSKHQSHHLGYIILVMNIRYFWKKVFFSSPEAKSGWSVRTIIVSENNLDWLIGLRLHDQSYLSACQLLYSFDQIHTVAKIFLGLKT